MKNASLDKIIGNYLLPATLKPVSVQWNNVIMSNEKPILIAKAPLPSEEVCGRKFQELKTLLDKFISALKLTLLDVQNEMNIIASENSPMSLKYSATESAGLKIARFAKTRERIAANIAKIDKLVSVLCPGDKLSESQKAELGDKKGELSQLDDQIKRLVTSHAILKSSLQKRYQQSGKNTYPSIPVPKAPAIEFPNLFWFPELLWKLGSEQRI